MAPSSCPPRLANWALQALIRQRFIASEEWRKSMEKFNGKQRGRNKKWTKIVTGCAASPRKQHKHSLLAPSVPFFHSSEVERSRREEFVPPDPKFGGVLVRRIPQPVPLIYPALSLSFPSEPCSVIIIHRVSQVLSNYCSNSRGGK